MPCPDQFRVTAGILEADDAMAHRAGAQLKAWTDPGLRRVPHGGDAGADFDGACTKWQVTPDAAATCGLHASTTLRIGSPVPGAPSTWLTGTDCGPSVAGAPRTYPLDGSSTSKPHSGPPLKGTPMTHPPFTAGSGRTLMGLDITSPELAIPPAPVPFSHKWPIWGTCVGATK